MSVEMFRYAYLVLLPLGLMGAVATTVSGDEPAEVDNAKQILKAFDAGDPGWKVRMQSLVHLARIGPDAAPLLVAGLQSQSPTTREFAAQALVMFANSDLRPALEQALEDQESGVRIYTIRALSMLGRLEPTSRYEHLLKDVSVFGVRPMAAAALDRHDRPNPESQNPETLRKAWAEYDLSQMDAARMGELAPDFSLPMYSGETVRLSQLRGQAVVLRYILFDY